MKIRQEENAFIVILNIIFAIALCLFAWTSTLAATNIPDSENYQTIYYSALAGNSFGIEIGFFYLCKLGNAVGLSYISFRMIYVAAAMAILIAAVIKYKSNALPFFACYLIYPFLLDSIQIRSAMAQSIVIYAATFLMSKNNNKRAIRKNGIIYVVLVLIAASQHIIALLYLSYIVVQIENDKWYKCTIIILAAAELLFLAGRSYMFKIVQGISLIRGQITQYSFGGNNISAVKYLAIYTACVLFAWKYRCEEKGKLISSKKGNRILLANYNVVILTLLNENMNRYFRTAIVLAYCFVFRSTEKKEIVSVFMRTGIIIVALALGWIFIYESGVYKFFY